MLQAKLDPDRDTRLLIYGGSFDPPHLAHVELPRLVAEAVGADRVVYVPAGKAPHKLDREQTAPVHRLKMLELALADERFAVIRTDELDRVDDGRPSYTVDTLERFAQEFPPDCEMRLLIGTDQVAIFEKWHRWERVIELAEPVVMMRPPEKPEDLPAVWRKRVIEVPTTTLSSTVVRERVARDQPLTDWVHPDVAAYIHDHGLYRPQATERNTTD